MSLESTPKNSKEEISAKLKEAQNEMASARAELMDMQDGQGGSHAQDSYFAASERVGRIAEKIKGLENELGASEGSGEEVSLDWDKYNKNLERILKTVDLLAIEQTSSSKPN